MHDTCGSCEYLTEVKDSTLHNGEDMWVCLLLPESSLRSKEDRKCLLKDVMHSIIKACGSTDRVDKSLSRLQAGVTHLVKTIADEETSGIQDGEARKLPGMSLLDLVADDPEKRDKLLALQEEFDGRNKG